MAKLRAAHGQRAAVCSAAAKATGPCRMCDTADRHKLATMAAKVERRKLNFNANFEGASSCFSIQR
jgi:hypothetical protein